MEPVRLFRADELAPVLRRQFVNVRCLQLGRCALEARCSRPFSKSAERADRQRIRCLQHGMRLDGDEACESREWPGGHLEIN